MGHFFTVVMQRLYRLSSNCADHFQFEGVASKLRRRHRTRDSLFTGVPHITKSFLKVTLAQRVYGSHVHSRAKCTSDQSSIIFPPSNLHPSSRSPSKRISELVPLEQTKQPAIKIMSRSVQDRIRVQSQSRTGSVNGEDAESSDVEPSEAGSLGGRSSALIRSKKALTMEERAAAYNEARSRIFLDFEKKSKEKDNDMSASSSTFSLVSGSASTSGGGSSSAGDIEDSISTAPTESEFSGPVARDNKSERRNGSGANSAGSSRAMLPHKHPSSSRGSRASSPSLTYASIYDPASNAIPYDASQAPPMQQPYHQQLMYHYPTPPQEQGSGQGFVPPIPYYSYGYPQPPPMPPPPPPQHVSSSEPLGPTADPQVPGLYLPPAQHPQQVMYMAPPYTWAPNSPPVAPSASLSGAPSLPHPHPSQYSFAHLSTPQYGGYNVPPFYPPMGPMHTPAQGQQPLAQPAHPVGMLPLPQGNDLGIRVMPPITMNNDHVDPRGRKRGNSRNGGGSLSHGPMVGYSFGVSGVTGGGSPIENNANIVGPRLNNSMRRISGTSNGSRTPGDEASSVAVS
jgi:SUZ domain-containing RNA-binding protein